MDTETQVLDGSGPSADEVKANDAAMLEQLDAILDKSGTHEEDDSSSHRVEEEEPKEEKPVRERDPSGKFKKSEQADKPESPKETPQPAVPEGVNPSEYEDAVKALHRDGVPPSAIDSLDPEAVVAWGQKRAKAQKDVDGYAARLRDLEKRKEDAPAKEAPQLDFSDAIKGITDIYGDEATGPFSKFAETIAAKVMETVPNQSSDVEQLRASLTARDREDARNRLDKDYKLGESDRWQRVLQYREWDQNNWSTEHEAIEAACQVLFSSERIAEAEAKAADKSAKLREQHKLRENGQSTTETRAAPPPKPPEGGDLDMAILDAILDGDEQRRDALSRQAKKPMNMSEVILGKKKLIG
jgi:hypothetical protein